MCRGSDSQPALSELQGAQDAHSTTQSLHSRFLMSGAALGETCEPCEPQACVGSLPPDKSTLLSNVLVCLDAGGYKRCDVLLAGGRIAKMSEPNTVSISEGMEVIDGGERMLLPGFVNAHTHSYEYWARGLVKPLPLELWLGMIVRHEARGEFGWHGEDSFEKTSTDAVFMSALLCGVESMLSGCTAILDHVFVRHIEDIGAVVSAYRALGIRAFVAPMLNDDRLPYSNFVPKTPDAAARNATADGVDQGAWGEGGSFRTSDAGSDPEKTRAMLALWEEAIKLYHRPSEGIEICIGPVTAYDCSEEMVKGASALRTKHGLCGHTHLLETRAQALMARTQLRSGSAVTHLKDAGFLSGRGTSCAHSIWLDPSEMETMGKEGASIVHNPYSNLRLGSGVLPLRQFEAAGVNVALGVDGPVRLLHCSLPLSLSFSLSLSSLSCRPT